jgi:hypothetical protein
MLESTSTPSSPTRGSPGATSPRPADPLWGRRRPPRGRPRHPITGAHGSDVPRNVGWRGQTCVGSDTAARRPRFNTHELTGRPSGINHPPRAVARYGARQPPCVTGLCEAGWRLRTGVPSAARLVLPGRKGFHRSYRPSGRKPPLDRHCRRGGFLEFACVAMDFGRLPAAGSIRNGHTA